MPQRPSIWIDHIAALKAAIDECLQEETIAIDAEGDGMFSYKAKLCTLQIATEKKIFLIDTLALWPKELFSLLLGPEGPKKIIHDVAFDARLLKAQGVDLRHVFDTSIAARFLGEPATGLVNLLASRCDVKLCKEQRLTDWGQRPLTKEQQTYLAEDVRHLHRLANSLEEDLIKKDIADEVQLECAYVLLQASNEAPLLSPWMRIKGVRRLAPIHQSVLREVALYREKIAKDWDCPPSMVVHDKAIFSLASKGVQRVSDLVKIRQFKKLKQNKLLEGLKEAIDRGLDNRRVPSQESKQLKGAPPPKGSISIRKQAKKKLSIWRKEEAEERKVDPQAILPGHCLSDIVKKLPKNISELEQIEGFGSKRLSRYGDTIVELIESV